MSEKPDRTVMVVEDDSFLREDVAQTFQDGGLTVIEAGSGEAAARALSDKPLLDALITDINLGGPIDGWDVADKVHAEQPEALVVYASGNSEQNPRRVRGSLFFSKPYRASAILVALRKWFARS